MAYAKLKEFARSHRHTLKNIFMQRAVFCIGNVFLCRFFNSFSFGCEQRKKFRDRNNFLLGNLLNGSRENMSNVQKNGFYCVEEIMQKNSAYTNIQILNSWRQVLRILRWWLSGRNLTCHCPLYLHNFCQIFFYFCLHFFF